MSKHKSFKIKVTDEDINKYIGFIRGGMPELIPPVKLEIALAELKELREIKNSVIKIN